MGHPMIVTDPAKIPALFKNALQMKASGKLAPARQVFTQILVLRPKTPEALFQIAEIDRLEGKWVDAAARLEQAHGLKPDEVAILEALTKTYQAAGDIDKAISAFDRIAKLHPKSVKPIADKALMLQQEGEFERAEKAFQRALKMNPLDGFLYRIYLATKKLQKGDPLITQMKKAYANPQMKDPAKAHLGFALAKALEDSGQYDRVFDYLKPANDQMSRMFPTNPDDRDKEVAAWMMVSQGLRAKENTQNNDAVPIFVAGLPRSGTTLVEQILASHPEVTGGGELPFVLAEALKTLGDETIPVHKINELSQDALSTFAKRYLKNVRARLKFDKVFTDKGVQSHLAFGLIHQSLPNARFIVVERDPRDTLFSIYKQVFAEGTHRYSYRLDLLVRYYQAHQKMMNFWKSQMSDHLHVVRYEDLVTNVEPHARALIAASGLEWDDACLDFHNTKRSVKTLSVHQVRKPVYSGSVGAWRRYKNELKPMIEALGMETE